MSVIEKVPFLHEIVIADAQELAQVISPGICDTAAVTQNGWKK